MKYEVCQRTLKAHKLYQAWLKLGALERNNNPIPEGVDPLMYFFRKVENDDSGIR